MFAFGPQDLQRFAIPIGIGIAVLVILVVPAFRRSIMNSFKKGHAAGKQLRGTNQREESHEDRTGGK
jgi:hypothetical protein